MTNLPRRAVLRGTALSALAQVSGGQAAPDPGARQAVSGPIVAVSDRRALSALADPAPGRVVFLGEGAREGLFECTARTGAAAGDRLQGLYVPSSRIELVWARVWDGTHGRPEWFGATTNNAAFDCADAIEACYAACAVTELAQADYFVRRTLRFARSWRTVRGCGRFASNEGQGTRIILQAAAPAVHTADIMVVGTVDAPTPIDALVTENHFSLFTLIRDGACTPHPSGDLARYPTGLRAKYLFHCTFSGISSLESSVGIYIGGVVYTKVDDCLTTRQRPGTSARNDFMVGYYLDGHVSFGYPGGNASLYMDRCVAADQNGAHVDPTGLRARGGFVDSFLDRFESARIDTGMAFDVDGKRGTGQTIDLHIRNPVLDGCGRFGLDINLDATASASIEITDPYVTPAGGRGDRGILVHDGAGLVTIIGGQIHGDFPGGSLYFSRTRGVTVQGTKIHQAVRPVVVDEASALHLEPQISNVGKTTNAFAVTCRAMTRSIVRPTVIAFNQPGFAGGVSLDPTSGFCQVDGTAIDPAAFTGGSAASKVVFAGVDARVGRAFDAAGHVLVGVTG